MYIRNKNWYDNFTQFDFDSPIRNIPGKDFVLKIHFLEHDMNII